MTALVIDDTETTALPAWAALGQCSEAGVYHAALLTQALSLTATSDAEYIEVVPAGFRRGKGLFQVAGFLPLTDEDQISIRAWIDDLDTRRPKTSYVCVPEFDEVADSKGDRVVASCAGLVGAAYAHVGRMLVDVAQAPAMTLAELEVIWPSLRTLDRKRIERYGFTPASPRAVTPTSWRVLLPGYLFHALASTTLPFAPALVHGRYPAT